MTGPYQIEPLLDTLAPVTLLDELELCRSFEVRQPWECYYRRLPSVFGLTMSSRVGFDAAREQALVYMVWIGHYLGGHGSLVYLIKRDGAWVIEVVDELTTQRRNHA
jgi:hypothetical protein